MDKKKLFSLICFITAALLALWWPLSHWFYSDWYHQLLGFLPGSYQDSMVKMIGTCGILPVICLIILGRAPEKNNLLLGGISLFSVLLGATFLYLILSGAFPQMEFINVGLTFGMALILPLFYKWAFRDSKLTNLKE